MVIIAACLYLPQHISFITKRAWFYYHGEDAGAASRVPLAPEAGAMQGARWGDEVVMETARAVAGAVLKAEGTRDVTGEL